MTKTLIPFHPAEAIGVTEAAVRVGKTDRTIRNWGLVDQIGRRIAQWAMSAPALDMLLVEERVDLENPQDFENS
jgi:hypothetical protein